MSGGGISISRGSKESRLGARVGFGDEASL